MNHIDSGGNVTENESFPTKLFCHVSANPLSKIHLALPNGSVILLRNNEILAPQMSARQHEQMQKNPRDVDNF